MPEYVPTPHPDRQFVSLATLALEWNMDRKTVRRLLDQGGVRAYVFGQARNASIRYARADVQRYLDRCRLAEKRVP